MIYKVILSFCLCVAAFAVGCGSDTVSQAADQNAATPEPQKTKEVTEKNKMEKVPNTNPVLEPATDIRLEAKISQSDDAITVAYEITNTSADEIYVLDAYPGVDPQTHAPYADLSGFYLCYREPATAVVLKGIPPLPSMPVTQRVMPLGTKLEPKGKLSRQFNLPLPLRERSDWYYQPQPPESYTISSVERMAFHVQFIRSKVEGFHAQPSPFSAEFFTVNSNQTVKQAETLKKEFSLGKMQLFVRKDMFTRL